MLVGMELLAEALMSREPDQPVYLAELAPKQAWMRDASCREPAYSGVNFFPERGEDLLPAKRVCGSCLVVDECIAFAVEHHERGIWGGTSERERRDIRKALKAA
jgi:WhiB family transcriptional regulator, redox-sensing transcriptional regulator